MVSVIRETSPDGRAFELALQGIEKLVGKVGWFENSRYEDGKPVAGIAAQNEYGNPAKRIPARPFMRPTIARQQQAWRQVVEQGARAVLQNKITMQQVLETLGSKAVFDIQKTISQLTQPALSEVTIKRRLERKSDKKTIGALTKPLIDTGVMFTTIYSIVESAP